MKGNRKQLFLVAVGCVAVGGVMALAGCAMMDGTLGGLDNGKLQAKTYTVGDAFENIHVAVDTADVVLAVSNDGTCKVVCTEKEKFTYNVGVENQTLYVKPQNDAKWYNNFTLFSFKEMKVEVYLPATAYARLTIGSDTGDINVPSAFTFTAAHLQTDTGDCQWAATASTLSIETDTGDIDARGFTAEQVSIATDTGDMDVENVTVSGGLNTETNTGETEMENVQCRQLAMKTDTGDIELKNTVALEKLTIESDTGEVSFVDVDSADIFVKTDTGDVEGSLQSGKIFSYKTDTGDVRLPANGDGGKCEIITCTGDIHIKIG